VEYSGRPAGLTQKVVLTALGGSSATPAGGLTAPVIVVRDFDELKARAAEVKGRIVLFDVRFDQNLAPQPAAATGYDVTPDGKTYTFHLRPDGRWSDGQPVTASQFEYSWKRILDPQLAAEYASFYVDAGIVGADDYNSGKVATPGNVGVHALDDLTLEIDLTQPFGPLPDLAALWVAVPERPDIIGANPTSWTQDPSTYIGNGPNLMVKAVAEAERYSVPSFFRYFVFAFTTMLPAHLIVSAALWWLDR